ncbi:MAG: sigma-70 family RNA polymerase sigma factor [Actinobacteria bacterium]|nr:sigma-70 family RNA polymerase sigma factor [Actinomycetota bacterium]
MDAGIAILWKSYKQNQDDYYRDKLIINYKPFLRKIVNSIYSKLPKTVDFHDLENYAYIGLLDAIRKFDLKRNIKFETYASYRIKGAVIDGMRKQDWLSRTMRSKYKNAEEENSESIELNETEYDGLKEIEYDTFEKENYSKENHNYKRDNNSNRVNVIGRFVMLSMDDPNFYGIKTSENSEYVQNLYDFYNLNTSEFAERLENIIFLREILLKLTPQEKKVVYLYYFKGKTFREIGKIMDITESRVSQINKKVLMFIKKNINSSSAVKF